MELLTNITLLTSAIAAIAAIIAPLITTWVNNKYQVKIRKMELFQNRKVEVIAAYTSAVSNYISSPNIKVRNDYYSCYGEVFLYVNKNHWSKIESLHHDIQNGNTLAASQKLPDVCKSLASEMYV